MSSNQEIYRGLWINWSKGQVTGATVTLSKSEGAYLVAFLALFVHLAGTSFWRLLRYTLFQARSRPNADFNDGITEQQQAILRNSTSSEASLRGFVKIMRRTKNVRKNSGLAALALVNFVGFVLAGIFSSKVTSATSDVLLRPTNCGRWWAFSFDHKLGQDFHNEKTLEMEMLEAGALHQLQTSSSHYATVCYNTDSPPDDCTAFGPRVPSWNSSIIDDYCPFGDGMCLHNTTFAIESGEIDSALDLGINTPPEDRLSIRLTKECAPITTDGYVKRYTARNLSSLYPPELPPELRFGYSLEGLEFDAFFYGYNRAILQDATFVFNNGTFQTSSGSIGDNPSYYLDIERYESSPQPLNRSSFDAIPSLALPEKDTLLVFLSSNVQYTQPISDPWFHAQHSWTAPWAGLDSLFYVTLYNRETPTSVLGCAEGVELCNRNPNSDGRCTRLMVEGYPATGGSGNKPGNITELLGLSKRQSAVAYRLQDASYRSSLDGILLNTGGQNLLAFQAISMQSEASFSTGLPSNQWTKEIENWFATQLTVIQLYTTQFVTGWQEQQYNKYVTLPTEEDQWMCHNQVIQRKDFASFSVLGLCIVLILGGLFLLLGLCLPRLVNLLRPKTPLNQYRQASWEVNELLEMQQTAALAIHRRTSSVFVSDLGTTSQGKLDEKTSTVRMQEAEKF